MKDCSERFFRRELGIIIILWTCVSQICLAFSEDNCSLPNGKAYPFRFGNQYIYFFTCKSGFELVGPQHGLCNADHPEQFCQYKKCGRTMPCSCTGNFRSHDRCICDSGEGPMEWRCTPNGWIPHLLCLRLATMPFMEVSYTHHNYNYNYYYLDGTEAKYSCTNQGLVFRDLTKCLNGTWSDPKPTYKICACRKLPGVVRYSDKNIGQYYSIGTKATYDCDGGYKAESSCTSIRWDGDTSCSKSSTIVPPVATKPHHEPTKQHHHEKKTLVIVSATTGAILVATKSDDNEDASHHEKKTLVIVCATTGAILGTLIILVVIVSCQRRLHYHRMRRARMRCRQDQDAFAAYITYHRDVRFMLPSYDEAVNQQGQGQPPTFAEAIASNAEGASPSEATPSAERTSPSEAPPPAFDDVSILVGISSEEDGEAPQASLAEGRFFRAVRMLFGGRSFTSRAIYCHLVPDGGEENGNAGAVQTQSSQPDGASDGLNNGSDEGGNDNQGLEVDSSGSDQATRDLNALLSRAGLC